MAKSIQISNNAGQSYGMDDYRANMVSVIREVLNALSRKERRILQSIARTSTFVKQNNEYSACKDMVMLDFVVANVRELMIDYSIQRDVVISHVRKLLKNWDPKVSTPLEVVQYINPNDSAHQGYWVYDGQQHSIAYILGNIINLVGDDEEVTNTDIETYLENIYLPARVSIQTYTWDDTENYGYDVFNALNSGRLKVEFYFDYRAGLRSKVDDTPGTPYMNSTAIRNWCLASGVDFVAPGVTDPGTTHQGNRILTNMVNEEYYARNSVGVIAGRIAKIAYPTQQLGIPVIRSISTVLKELVEAGVVDTPLVHGAFDTVTGQEVEVSQELMDDICSIYSTIFGDAQKGYTIAKEMWQDMCIHVHGGKGQAMASVDWELGNNIDHERQSAFALAIADIMGYDKLSGVIAQLNPSVSRIYRIANAIDTQWLATELSQKGFYQILSKKKAA